MNSTAASDGSRQDLGKKVEQLCREDGIHKDLMELVRIPSVYDPGGTDPVRHAADACTDLFRQAGARVRQIPVGDEPASHAPLVYAEVPCADPTPTTPTVLLYAHYDVVPADSGWSEAFTPGIADGRMTGRGAADDKSGIMLHLGAVRAFDASPPVHLKIVLEGEEEKGTGTLEKYIADHPEMFSADVVSVADGGNVRLGVPTLVTSLRGFSVADVTVSTLDSPVHSGMYGGPAPDAFMALTRMLATLHDNEGNVAVPGLRRDVWEGWQPSPERFRSDAGVKRGVRLLGTGSIGSRLCTKPSVSVTGLDGPPGTGQAANVLQHRATARISMRISPQDDPFSAFDCLRRHLRSPRANPWHAQVGVSYVAGASGYRAAADGPGYSCAERALAGAYGVTEVQRAGQGASIPLVNRLQEVNPDAAVLVWGCEEPGARIHSDHESVSLAELQRMMLAQCRLIELLGDGGTPFTTGRPGAPARGSAAS